MNLQEYSERILRPEALNAVCEGRCDNAIRLREVHEFYADDIEMMQAIKDRLEILDGVKL